MTATTVRAGVVMDLGCAIPSRYGAPCEPLPGGLREAFAGECQRFRDVLYRAAHDGGAHGSQQMFVVEGLVDMPLETGRFRALMVGGAGQA